MIPRAAGATSPKWCTWAMTSCRSRRSSSATRSRSISSIRSRIWEIASSGIGSPSSRWLSARAIQRRRHVVNLNAGEKIRLISSEVYRSTSGFWYDVGAPPLSSSRLTPPSATDTEAHRSESALALEEHLDQPRPREPLQQPRGLLRRGDRDPVDLDDEVALAEPDPARHGRGRHDQRALLADQPPLRPDRGRERDQLEVREGTDP